MKNNDFEILWPKEIKKTKTRINVIEILKQADRPMTAMDIFDAVKAGKEAVWISTIYRILDTFAEKNIIMKTEVIESGMAVYELNRHEHKHYAVCVSCHKVIPMKNCPIDSFVPQLKDNNFHVLGHKLEMYGYCESCYQG